MGACELTYGERQGRKAKRSRSVTLSPLLSHTHLCAHSHIRTHSHTFPHCHRYCCTHSCTHIRTHSHYSPRAVVITVSSDGSTCVCNSSIPGYSVLTLTMLFASSSCYAFLHNHVRIHTNVRTHTCMHTHTHVHAGAHRCQLGPELHPHPSNCAHNKQTHVLRRSFLNGPEASLCKMQRTHTRSCTQVLIAVSLALNYIHIQVTVRTTNKHTYCAAHF